MALAPVPLRDQVLEKTGLPTPSWVRWLNSLLSLANLAVVSDSNGNVGIGTTTVPGQTVSTGRRYVTIIGETSTGVLEFETNQADADGNVLGVVQFTDINSIAADKRIAVVGAVLSGATAGNRGGLLRFETKANGGVLTRRMTITEAGQVGIGTATPGSIFAVVGLPTSAAGLSAGDIWCDTAAANVLKVV